MRFSAGRLLTIAICVVSVFAAATPINQKPLQQDVDVTVRLATVDDARSIAEIILTAFADLPHIKYVYQNINADNLKTLIKCLTLDLAEGLSYAHVFAHLGVVHTDDGEEVVSAAAWKMPWLLLGVEEPYAAINPVSPFNFMPATSLEQCPGTAINTTRAEQINNGLGLAEERLLWDVYGSHQLYLAVIGTLPKYQGHDIAGRLLRQGIQHGLAKYPRSHDSLYATLSATEPGEVLYFENGYASIENISIPSLEGDQHFRFDVMEKLIYRSE
jgi:ribosomal protein S18 acetylase RimI-like enzyme